MRIRSIKPEFWTSDDIAGLSIEDRLLFIGLWSYVDDNGVGEDREPLIVAALFPLDHYDNPRETIARVSRGLQTLFDKGLITRYISDEHQLLQVNAWEKHQRIDRPNKPRFPRYEAIRDTLASVSRDYRETPSTGTGEQGNRGTGDIPPIVPLAGDGANTNLDGPYPAWEHLPAKGNSKIYPEQFTQWHDAYPHARDQSDLKNQYRAWRQAITRDTIENILDGTHRYANDPNRAPTYTPSAARWLRKNGWQDPALPPRQPSMYTRSQQAAAADFARLTNQNTPPEIERNPQ